MALPLAWLAGVALPAAAARCSGGSKPISLITAARLSWSRWPAALAASVRAAGRRRAGGGFALAGAASLRLADALPAALEGRDVVVTGVVASLPQQGPSGLRFRFEVDAGGAPARRCRGVIALGWYAGFHEDAALVQPRCALRAGQRWRFTVRLRQPHGNLNPHGFDYELALLEQGVRATGYVRDAPATLLDASAGHPVERLRQRVRDAIYAARQPTAAPPACWRRSRSATRRDRARRLGPVPQHRRRPPDVDQRPARHDVRVARRRLHRRAWRRSTRAMLRLPAP